MSATRDSIADVWGPRTPQAGSHRPIRVYLKLDEYPDRGRPGPEGLHGWVANASSDQLTRPLAVPS